MAMSNNGIGNNEGAHMVVSGDNASERERGHSDLADLLEVFDACRKRAFQYVAGNGLPDPDPEKDVPVDLLKYKAAAKETMNKGVALKKIKEEIIAWIMKTDSKKLAEFYPSMSRVCVAYIPELHEGLPDMVVRQFQVSEKGLTMDLQADPSYEYLLLPREIQEKCVVEVPAYKNMDFLTEEERKVLAAKVEKAFENLEEALL